MGSSSSYLIPLTFMMIAIIAHSAARELRPSEHGLDYQSSPPELPPEMKEFFRSRPNPTGEMPRAMNSNESTWWDHNVVGGDRGGDRLRHVLLVGSLACGAVGAALLALSAFIYFGRYKTQTRITNSKAIVITQ